ncbi:MAG: hypothetical protein ABI707_04795 [Ferruginibacter sp.]
MSFFLILFTYSARSQDIPSSRRTDWTLAGYHGAIPAYPIVKNIMDYGGLADGIGLNDIALQNAITGSTN